MTGHARRRAQLCSFGDSRALRNVDGGRQSSSSSSSVHAWLESHAKHTPLRARWHDASCRVVSCDYSAACLMGWMLMGC